jgi:hypothetical protein
MPWSIRQGDSRELAAVLPPNSIDAIVCDPPAGIDFLGKEWDGDKGGRDSWIAWLTGVMEEGFRVLKPGGHAVVWAIPRTSHWTATALENAGFEIRQVVSHLFGSGFPHGLDIGKAMDRMRDDDIYHVTAFIAAARDAAGKTNPEIDQHFDYHGMAGHWTSNKSQPAVPTWENWLKLKAFLGFDESMDAEVQRLNGRKGKPGDPWYERPILGWETDGVAGHVFGVAGAAPTYKQEFAITGHVSDEAHAWDGWNTALRPAAEHWIIAQKPIEGRGFASNILQHGVGAYNIKGCQVPSDDPTKTGWPANVVLSHSPACGDTCAPSCPVRALGPEARFFNQFRFGPEDWPAFLYCKKPSREEKEAGCQEAGIEPVEMKRTNSGGLENDPRWAPKMVYNNHATVKSIALMRWLSRLVAPKGATVLDLFCGSGTTGCAAVLEGMSFLGFDLDARHVAISDARTAYWAATVGADQPGALPVLAAPLARPAALAPVVKKKAKASLSLSLFDTEDLE